MRARALSTRNKRASSPGCAPDTDPESPVTLVRESFSGYTRSTFLPSQPFGTRIHRNLYNINLERIDFPDGVFDLILSTDVMEHVRDDAAAHREILRCLKPGGSYVFTVPYNPAYENNRLLVDTSAAADVLLTKPHFHGDPITGGILAYRVYGHQLHRDLESVGCRVRFREGQIPALGIVEGDCFVATKAFPIDTS